MGHAVIIKRGVEVAVSVIVVLVVGQAVIWNRGVLVADIVDEGVAVSVVVVDAVSVVVVDAVSVFVVDAVSVGVAVKVSVVVGEDVGGAAVGETDATSLPTVRSTPQTCGRVSVAE